MSAADQSWTQSSSMSLDERYNPRQLPAPDHEARSSWRPTNVGRDERLVSAASGAILAMLGAGRRDLLGLLIAGAGAGLVYRGATGHCSMYEALGLSTAGQTPLTGDSPSKGIHVSYSMLINKSPEELYAFWRNFENLPQIMTHLESVKVLDERRSHWVAKAPSIAGGKVEWDAEIIADEPGKAIAWRSLPGADVDNRGSVAFVPALGDRGTAVRVVMD